MNKMIQEIQNQIKKPYAKKALGIAVFLAAFYVWEIFFFSDFLGMRLGTMGVEIHEIFLAVMGVVVFIIFRGKLKKIYPFKKPKLMLLLATFLMWFGAYLITMVITLAITVFFPEQMMNASSAVDQLVQQLPLMTGIFMVALTPAICEEMAFRGALLSCFRGFPKWPSIILVGLFFGACHGSIWRMIPTGILGIVMGYLVMETDNMIYNMFFHFINNLYPVLLLGMMKTLQDVAGMEGPLMESTSAAEMKQSALMMLPGMIKTVALGPILMYIAHRIIQKYKNS